MGVYDQAGRYTVKRDPDTFFAWRAQRFVQRYAFLRWADTTTIAFPGEPDRICDTVAEFAPRDGTDPRRLLDVECQTEPHPDMLERIGEYAYRLRRELREGEGNQRKYRVISVLLSLTGSEQPAELDMREADLDDAGSLLRVLRITLSSEDAAATLGRIATGELGRAVLPWIPLMRGGGEAAIIEEWKRLATQEPDAHRRADFGGLALVFAELAKCRPAWKQALEGWNVQVSQQVLEWQAQARLEGEQKGRLEGEQKGRLEGELTRARQDVLRAFQVRLQSPMPDDLKAALGTITDTEELSRWLEAAIASGTVTAFRAAVKHPGNSANGA